jgi:hypothetical protein
MGTTGKQEKEGGALINKGNRGRKRNQRKVLCGSAIGGILTNLRGTLFYVLDLHFGRAALPACPSLVQGANQRYGSHKIKKFT